MSKTFIRVPEYEVVYIQEFASRCMSSLQSLVGMSLSDLRRMVSNYRSTFLRLGESMIQLLKDEDAESDEWVVRFDQVMAMIDEVERILTSYPETPNDWQKVIGLIAVIEAYRDSTDHTIRTNIARASNEGEIHSLSA